MKELKDMTNEEAVEFVNQELQKSFTEFIGKYNDKDTETRLMETCSKLSEQFAELFKVNVINVKVEVHDSKMQISLDLDSLKNKS